MNILKISDGFVTNHSNYGITVILAVRKGQEFKNIIKKIGIPNFLPTEFFDFYKDDNEIAYSLSYSNIEFDYLTEEYDLYMNYIETNDVHEGFAMAYSERRALEEMIDKIKKYKDNEIILLMGSKD
ncbi:MAG: hypothetical protein GF383_14785 [Candidatus Lokiarchaeota archaeon]|nr:hypothetical protein [Candidatus Lokiarchaeota archaeon]MBD3342682.1 hypothetical protein [Candidatus Lokiarchaeota archaeon]